MSDFNFQEYMSNGVANVVKSAVRATLKNPREALFMAEFAVAAGRGFFHINSHGGAEPCPFSPYSDINVKETSLREALKSKLFRALQDKGVLKEDHAGGCILFEKKSIVESLLN